MFLVAARVTVGSDRLLGKLSSINNNLDSWKVGNDFLKINLILHPEIRGEFLENSVSTSISLLNDVELKMFSDSVTLIS